MVSSPAPPAAPLLADLSFLSEQAAPTEKQLMFFQTAGWRPVSGLADRQSKEPQSLIFTRSFLDSLTHSDTWPLFHSYSKYHASAWRILDTVGIICTKQTKAAVDMTLPSRKGDSVSKRSSWTTPVINAKDKTMSGKSHSKCWEGLHTGTVAEEGSLRRCHLSESLQEVGGEPGYLHKSMSGRPLREHLGHLQPKGGKAGAK